MKQPLRHQAILDLVQSHGHLSTEDLAQRLNVSTQTIRRDLQQLDTQQLLQRHHGGAMMASSHHNTDYRTRQNQHKSAKEAIGLCIAQQIPNHCTLFIDIGTTPEMAAKALCQHQGLNIVTNNLNAASWLTQNTNFQVLIAGGEIRNHDGGIIGESTVDFINQFRLDYGILGISGIDEDGTLLEFDFHEAKTKQAIIANSRQALLACDHSKFGRNAMSQVGHLYQIDQLFTDKIPSDVIQQYLLEHDVEWLCPEDDEAT